MKSKIKRDKKNVTLYSFIKDKGFNKIKLKKSKVGHYHVEGKVNGKKAEFILDTGASASVLDQARIAYFDLKPKEHNAKASGLGATDFKVQRSINNKMILGKLLIGSYALKIIDLSHVNRALRSKGVKQIDGVIGADILNKKKAIIDCGNLTMYLK